MIKVKIDFDYGDAAYMRDDPEQIQRTFVGARIYPGGIQYVLDYLGEETYVYDFLVTKEPDQSKKLGFSSKEEE